MSISLILMVMAPPVQCHQIRYTADGARIETMVDAAKSGAISSQSKAGSSSSGSSSSSVSVSSSSNGRTSSSASTSADGVRQSVSINRTDGTCTITVDERP